MYEYERYTVTRNTVENIIPFSDDASSRECGKLDHRRPRKRSWGALASRSMDRNSSRKSDNVLSVGSYRLMDSDYPISTPSISTIFNGRNKKMHSKLLSGFPVDEDQRVNILVVLITVVVLLFLIFLSSSSVDSGYSNNHSKNHSGNDKIDDTYVTNEQSIFSLIKISNGRYNERHWPWSTYHDEVMDFELINHPYPDAGKTYGSDHHRNGNNVMLSVPPFFIHDVDKFMIQHRLDTLEDKLYYSLLGNQGKLLTKEIANSIGSFTTNSGRKNNDPNTRTIFVGIISYRNPRCRNTVESVFSRARYPDRLRVAIVDQINPDIDLQCGTSVVSCEQNPNQVLCRYSTNIDLYLLEATLATGSSLARHIVNRMYRGEYYSLQIHDHVVFVQDWDVSIIKQHDSTDNEMAVISTYMEQADGNIDKDGKADNVAEYAICNASFEGFGKNRFLKHLKSAQPLVVSPIEGYPYLHPFWSSSFSFSRGHFILNVPYDPYLTVISTDDEEISMALRAWTHGYDFYVPDKSVCFNGSFVNGYMMSFDDGIVAQHTFLEQFDKKNFERLYKRSLNRLYEIVQMRSKVYSGDMDNTEIEKYGLGHVRDVQTFFRSFGIHSSERITERKLCEFVSSGAMHREFSVFLRNDSMGIDYGKINFRFHELIRIHEG